MRRSSLPRSDPRRGRSASRSDDGVPNPETGPTGHNRAMGPSEDSLRSSRHLSVFSNRKSSPPSSRTPDGTRRDGQLVCSNAESIPRSISGMVRRARFPVCDAMPGARRSPRSGGGLTKTLFRPTALQSTITTIRSTCGRLSSLESHFARGDRSATSWDIWSTTRNMGIGGAKSWTTSVDPPSSPRSSVCSRARRTRRTSPHSSSTVRKLNLL